MSDNAISKDHRFPDVGALIASSYEWGLSVFALFGLFFIWYVILCLVCSMGSLALQGCVRPYCILP